jgi:hypothetical protein
MTPINLGSYTPNTYYVAVALFRQTDGTLSPATVGSIVLPDDPDTPQPVLSGYQQ